MRFLPTPFGHLADWRVDPRDFLPTPFGHLADWRVDPHDPRPEARVYLHGSTAPRRRRGR